MDIDRVIATISRWDPSFPGRLRGASPDEIAAYEEALGHPLPAACRAYFEAMGRDNGGLDFAATGEIDIGALTEWLRINRESSSPYFPRDSCLIGVFPQPGYYVILHPLEDPDLPVHYSDETPVDRFADGLDKMLVQTAYELFRLSRFPHRAGYHSKDVEVTLTSACELACSIGFASDWFSDSINGCLERADASLLVSRFDEDRLYLSACAVSADALRRVQEELVRPLDLEPWS